MQLKNARRPAHLDDGGEAGNDMLTPDQEKFLGRWREAGGIGIEARDIKAVADELAIGMLL